MMWIGLTTVALLGLLLAERAGSRRGVRMFKPIASVGFLCFALQGGALESAYGRAIFAGLSLSWFGYVFLMSKRSGWFLAGLVAFLAAHVAYIIAFIGLGPSWSMAALSGVALARVAWSVRRWLRPSLPADMKRPVDGYIAVITVMVATAFGAWGTSGSNVLLAGAITFYLSDLSVARDRFVAPGFVNRLWGLPLYYGAQLLLGRTC